MSDFLTLNAPDAVTLPGAICEHCSAPFEPRKGNGGKPQKYCSEECRRAADAQRRQCGPTRSDETVSVESPPATDNNALMDWPFSRDIQRQYEVRILALSDGGVELGQATQYARPNDDEAPVIEVTSGNVVRLALGILDAAGFKKVTITTDCDDGELELKSGSCASDLTYSPPRPKVEPKPKSPSPPSAELKPIEPPYNPWEDDEAVCLQEQKCTAVYRNPYDGLVIRQMDHDESTVIIVAENIPAFIRRITQIGAAAPIHK